MAEPPLQLGEALPRFKENAAGVFNWCARGWIPEVHVKRTSVCGGSSLLKTQNAHGSHRML